jgi:hypothetical protein
MLKNILSHSEIRQILISTKDCIGAAKTIFAHNCLLAPRARRTWHTGSESPGSKRVAVAGAAHWAESGRRPGADRRGSARQMLMLDQRRAW